MSLQCLSMTLALPAAALTACWALLVAQAMLLAEVNLGVMAIRVRDLQACTGCRGSVVLSMPGARGSTVPHSVSLPGWALAFAPHFLWLSSVACCDLMQAQQQSDDKQAASQNQQQMVTLRQMADATLGRVGGTATSAIYLLLSFSLLTAYIAKVRPGAAVRH